MRSSIILPSFSEINNKLINSEIHSKEQLFSHFPNMTSDQIIDYLVESYFSEDANRLSLKPVLAIVKTSSDSDFMAICLLIISKIQLKALDVDAAVQPDVSLKIAIASDLDKLIVKPMDQQSSITPTQPQLASRPNLSEFAEQRIAAISLNYLNNFNAKVDEALSVAANSKLHFIIFSVLDLLKANAHYFQSIDSVLKSCEATYRAEVKKTLASVPSLTQILKVNDIYLTRSSQTLFTQMKLEIESIWAIPGFESHPLTNHVIKYLCSSYTVMSFLNDINYFLFSVLKDIQTHQWKVNTISIFGSRWQTGIPPSVVELYRMVVAGFQKSSSGSSELNYIESLLMLFADVSNQLSRIKIKGLDNNIWVNRHPETQMYYDQWFDLAQLITIANSHLIFSYDNLMHVLNKNSQSASVSAFISASVSMSEAASAALPPEHLGVAGLAPSRHSSVSTVTSSESFISSAPSAGSLEHLKALSFYSPSACAQYKAVKQTLSPEEAAKKAAQLQNDEDDTCGLGL